MFRQGRTRDAIPFFEKATAVMETDWHNPSMLMTCYQGDRDAEQLKRVARITIERVEKAISKDPSNAPALSTGASALALLGEDDRASDWIDRALLLAPDDIMMRYNLACALDPGSQEPRSRDRDDQRRISRAWSARPRSSMSMRIPISIRIRDDPRFKEMLAAAKQRLGITANMAKIFLSYAREDVDAAKQLAGASPARVTRCGGTGISRADRGSPTRSTGR